VYLDSIRLTNIRGFEHLKFDLQREDGSYAGWTVITGDNGSGKSTLLKAIAVALIGPERARALQPSFRGWLREGAESGRLAIKVKPTDLDEEFVRTAIDGFSANIGLQNGSAEPTLVIESSRPARRAIWAGDALGWFSCGYGPFRRVLARHQRQCGRWHRRHRNDL